MKKYFTYLARCNDSTLYTGYTDDIKKRESAHNIGQGAKYTKARRPIKIIYWEKLQTKSLAMKREAEIKKWPKIKKESLVQK